MAKPTTTKEPRVLVPARIDPPIKRVLDKIAFDDKSTVSRTIEKLLATHPRVKKLATAG
jgi:hypothetical protein